MSNNIIAQFLNNVKSKSVNIVPISERKFRMQIIKSDILSNKKETLSDNLFEQLKSYEKPFLDDVKFESDIYKELYMIEEQMKDGTWKNHRIQYAHYCHNFGRIIDSPFGIPCFHAKESVKSYIKMLKNKPSNFFITLKNDEKIEIEYVAGLTQYYYKTSCFYPELLLDQLPLVASSKDEMKEILENNIRFITTSYEELK